MMYHIMMLVFFIYNLSFSQVMENYPNLVSYVGDTKVGLCVNPIFTGLKGKVPNQETDINIALFYQNKYLFQDNEVLGVVEGRLITESALSSYDILDKVRREKTSSIAKYASHFEQYQEALEKFQKFQDRFKILDLDVDKTDYVEENQKEASLKCISVNFVAQSFDLQKKCSFDYFGSFPELEMPIECDQKFSEKEIEFLIQYEKLKKIYNHAVEEYNKAIAQDAEKGKDYFDPADSTEFFTVVFMGEHDRSVWVKKFGLDGSRCYQSHDDKVWYLGYQLDITKKDIRALSQVFTNNEKVQHVVKGSRGSVEFQLSGVFIRAVKELVNLYLQGVLIIDPSIESPIMENS